jgi:S-methylmethionine-dependent homocysteine/selenocysteine methylase
MPAIDDAPLRLDGGVATALERAGIPVVAPWWTTSALLTEVRRRTLRAVHGEFLAAGARVVTANTFRCNVRALRGAGRLDGAGSAWMVHAAVGVALAARAAGGARGAVVAGSMAPVEDCYRPDLVPADEELRAEHGWLAAELLRAGVDVVLIETMNTEREARIALEQVLALGGRAWVSFVCGPDGQLLSGEPVAAAVRAVARDGAGAVLVNCTPLADTEDALRRIRDVHAGPVGAYPNVERLPRGRGDAAVAPAAFAATLARWHDDFGLSLVGGCCGAGPAHIAALDVRLREAA